MKNFLVGLIATVASYMSVVWLDSIIFQPSMFQRLMVAIDPVTRFEIGAVCFIYGIAVPLALVFAAMLLIPLYCMLNDIGEAVLKCLHKKEE